MSEDKIQEAIGFYKKKDWRVNVRKQLNKKDKFIGEPSILKQHQIDGKNETVSDQIVYQT